MRPIEGQREKARETALADVLIVCVREDEPQAKALAEMFEAAGFSIGGAPSSDAALRSSGAGVVVWSQASIRSRPFLDAAQRVINADKAVVASLIEPPPPSSIGNSLAFDLSRWDGDPNDPSLDPLFFAVDRMVNSARASVGAPAREEAYDPPPQPTRAAPRPTPAPPAPPPRAAPPADPLDSESEHWRAIRDSRNPADFMDYIARYGPQGAFAEVAELRLKQLTAGAEAARAPTPQRRPEPPAPRYTPPPRAEAPPRREPPPVRRLDPPPPPQRRAEAPPPQRRMPPPPERIYDRNDLREPPSSGGGPLRAFILIALLGGAALAGGLYFGGGMGDIGANAPQEQTDSASTEPLDAPGEVPLGETGEVEQAAAPERTQAELRQEQQRTREQERRDAERREAERREQERLRELNAAATPPMTTRNTVVATNNQPASGGPVSLNPGASSSSLPAPVQPLAPSQQPPVTTIATNTVASAEPTVRGPAGTVSWAQRPTARRISDLYPRRALNQGIGGRVQLDCVIQADLSASCSIASESPAGEGFGRAALSASSSYRAQPNLSNGQSAVGSRTRIAVAFQAPQ